MKLCNLIIIHFAPIELYPPIQNILGELGREQSLSKVIVITTRSVLGNPKLFEPLGSNIRLLRIGKSGAKQAAPLRYFNYLLFFSICLIVIFWYRPRRLFYVETISSWPAYVYKRFFNKKCDVLIHYHEYVSNAEYRNGMILNRYFHRLEKWLYPKADWISHTNRVRMEMFKRDIRSIEIHNDQILPNYPSRKWNTSPKYLIEMPLKVVYVGSLSLTTMYTKNFANWVVSQQGKVVWDIYAFNFTADTNDYLRKLNCNWIRLLPGINYHDLPTILRRYDVGVILYTGHVPNYIFNAPNKLFEYLACGLDVWFPKVMTGSLEFVRESTLPKIVSFDFSNLQCIDLSSTLERGDCVKSENSFFCEDVLHPLIVKLTV